MYLCLTGFARKSTVMLCYGMVWYGMAWHGSDGDEASESNGDGKYNNTI